MKYLILLVMVLAGIWWIRKQRPHHKSAQQSKPSGPQAMVTCAHCGAHVPSDDAVAGQQAVYCSEAHRQLREA